MRPTTEVANGELRPAHGATMDYWHKLKQGPPPTIARFSVKSTPERVRVLRECSKWYRELPTLDVDPEAVTFGLECGGVLEEMATYIEETESPLPYVQRYGEAMSGDPFGAIGRLARDSVVRDEKLKASLQRHQSRSAATRAYLTQKYGVEFPIAW